MTQTVKLPSPSLTLYDDWSNPTVAPVIGRGIEGEREIVKFSQIINKHMTPQGFHNPIMSTSPSVPLGNPRIHAGYC